MAYTDNPVEDFHRRDKEQSEWLDTLPICAECRHPIQDDECFEFEFGLICPDCLKDNHRRSTDDFIEY